MTRDGGIALVHKTSQMTENYDEQQADEGKTSCVQDKGKLLESDYIEDYTISLLGRAMSQNENKHRWFDRGSQSTTRQPPENDA